MSPSALEDTIAAEVRSVGPLSVADLVSRVLRTCPKSSFSDVHAALDRAVNKGTVFVHPTQFMLRATGH